MDCIYFIMYGSISLIFLDYRHFAKSHGKFYFCFFFLFTEFMLAHIHFYTEEFRTSVMPNRRHFYVVS